MKPEFLPYQRRDREGWRYRCLWEWACGNTEAPDLSLGSGPTPATWRLWVWASSHLRPALALDGFPGLVLLNLVPVDGISEPISQLFYDTLREALQRQRPVPDQGHEGPPRALPVGDMPTTKAAPQIRHRVPSAKTSRMGGNTMTPGGLLSNKWVEELGPQLSASLPVSHDLGHEHDRPSRLLTPNNLLLLRMSTRHHPRNTHIPRMRGKICGAQGGNPLGDWPGWACPGLSLAT